MSAATTKQDTPTSEEFTPVRFWNAGPGFPQEKVLRPGSFYGVKFSNGSAVATNPADADLIRRTLSGRVWEEDLKPGKPDLVCEACGWHCRSTEAWGVHMNRAHPTMQVGPR